MNSDEIRGEIKERWGEYLEERPNTETPSLIVNYLREHGERLKGVLEDAYDDPNLNYPTSKQLYGEKLGKQNHFTRSLVMLNEIEVLESWGSSNGSYTWDLVHTDLHEVKTAIDVAVEEGLEPQD